MNSDATVVHGIKDLGVLRPEDVASSTIPIITAHQIRIIGKSLENAKRQGLTNLAILGNRSKVLPPDSVRYVIAFLRRDPSLGLTLWQDGRVLFARVNCLAELIAAGLSNDDLPSLLRNAAGTKWTARRIALSQAPCKPLGAGDPGHLAANEKTAMIPARTMDGPQVAKEFEQKASDMAQSKQYTEALAALQEALERYPESAFAWNLKAGLHHVLKQFEAAIRASDCAVDLCPQHPHVWMTRGELLWKAFGRDDEAAECFREALRLGDQTAQKALADLAHSRHP